MKKFIITTIIPILIYSIPYHYGNGDYNDYNANNMYIVSAHDMSKVSLPMDNTEETQETSDECSDGESDTYIYEESETEYILEETEIANIETMSDEELAIAYRINYNFARLVMAEAEGESFEGKMMVALVIMNRVASPKFPNDIESVIFQSGQFTCIIDGRFYSVEPNEDCFLAIQQVVEGWNDGSNALYFSASSGGWHDYSLTYIKQVGNHKFYR